MKSGVEYCDIARRDKRVGEHDETITSWVGETWLAVAALPREYWW